MSLTAEAIAGADDLEREKVDVPKWGGEVWVTELSGKGGERFFKKEKGEGGKDGEDDKEDNEAEVDDLFVHRVIALTLCDEKGVLVFKDVKTGIEVLRDKKTKILRELFKTACRLNGVDLEEGEAGKGPGATTEDDSGSS